MEFFFIIGGLLCIAGIFLYFLPGLIAGKRKHKYSTLITILNIFIGWTVLGWLALLVWAFMDNNSKTTSSIDDLKTLAELKEKGLITEEEFNNKKSEILNKN